VAYLRKKFLGDPAVNAEIKRAIEKGLVIPGMCPFQAFAAAALPGVYEVRPDPKRCRFDTRRSLGPKRLFRRQIRLEKQQQTTAKHLK
jgi:hypothetical protein